MRPRFTSVHIGGKLNRESWYGEQKIHMSVEHRTDIDLLLCTDWLSRAHCLASMVTWLDWSSVFTMGLYKADGHWPTVIYTNLKWTVRKNCYSTGYRSDCPCYTRTPHTTLVKLERFAWKKYIALCFLFINLFIWDRVFQMSDLIYKDPASWIFSCVVSVSPAALNTLRKSSCSNPSCS
jgi:hypothetical protein